MGTRAGAGAPGLSRRWWRPCTAAGRAPRTPDQGFQARQRLRFRGHYLVYRGAFERSLSACAEVGGQVRAANEGYVGGVRTAALVAAAEVHLLRGDVAPVRAIVQELVALQPDSSRWIYFAGRLSALAGDRPTAETCAERLRSLQSKVRYSTRDLYLQALESELALAAGQYDTARRLAEAVADSPRRLADYEMNTEFAGAAFLDTLARANLALGRPHEAAEALTRIVDRGFESVSQPILYVRAFYALGRIELALGNTARGRARLRQFLDYWDTADGDRAEVTEARRLLGARSGGAR